MVAPFDPNKDRRNRAEHHIGLARFDDLTQPVAIYSPRDGEDRWVILGYIDDRLHSAVVTRRDGDFRPISLRRANRREKKDYARVYPTRS
jgi:uncharacterized DUF497 family protein